MNLEWLRTNQEWEKDVTSGPVEIGLVELIKKVRIYTVGPEIRLSRIWWTTRFSW